MPIISDGNNLIGNEVTDEHTVLGKTMHSGSYHLSGTAGGNVFLINSPDMTSNLSVSPGGASIQTAPAIGVYENSDGVQPTIAIGRGDDTKTFGGSFLLSRHSSTGAVGPGDVLGDITAAGHDGTDYNQAAQINFFVDGNVSTDGMPGRIDFSTNPGDGSTVFPVARMSIDSHGSVGIGTSSPTEILTLNAESQGAPTISFKEDDTELGTIGINASQNILIENKKSNKHIVFKASDAGVSREGFRLDGAVPEVVVNQTSDSLVNFRVESDNNTHMLYVDGTNDRIGIGVSTPAHSLEVSGDVYLSGTLSYVDVMLLELSVPNVDLQTDTYAHRIYAPYDIDVDNVFYTLDSHATSGDVTVTLTNTTTSTEMSSVTLAGTALTGSDFSITSPSVSQGDALTFAITNAGGTSQGLHASLYFRRSI